MTWLVFLGLLNAFPHSAQQAWITIWPCLVFTGGAWIITRFGQRDRWRVLGVGILETFGLRPFSTELWIFYVSYWLFLIATLIYTAALVLTSPRPKTFAGTASKVVHRASPSHQPVLIRWPGG